MLHLKSSLYEYQDDHLLCHQGFTRDMTVEVVRDKSEPWNIGRTYILLKLYCLRQQNGASVGGIQLDFVGPLKEGFEKLVELKCLAKNSEDLEIVDQLVGMMEQQLNQRDYSSERRLWREIKAVRLRC